MPAFSLEFQDVMVDGLPEINDENTSVIFLWDGNVCSGWPVTELAQGIPLGKNYMDVIWECADFMHENGAQLAGIRYWAYIPGELYDLSLV